MGKAGVALRQVLEKYEITQNKLAVTMRIGRANIHRWIHEQANPTGDNILAIRDALREISPEAANDFIRSYLGQLD